jgi:hypothetical protein
MSVLLLCSLEATVFDEAAKLNLIGEHVMSGLISSIRACTYGGQLAARLAWNKIS